MNYNPYWAVYKNLERELVDLSSLIHIDDKQLAIYSIKISELLIRTVVEVESISKELYFQNGGTKINNHELFFDTDCLDLLESKWQLGKKQVLISAPNFYFDLAENNVLTPLKKANKRGNSSSGWLKAYQAVKHNRVLSLNRGNLKNFIHAMGALFILNLYYKDVFYELEKDSTGTNFDNSLGSSIFSVKLHISAAIYPDGKYEKKPDFDECVYLLQPTSKAKNMAEGLLKTLNDKATEMGRSTWAEELGKEVSGMRVEDQADLEEKVNSALEKIKNKYLKKAVKENDFIIKRAMKDLKYEAVLNKQQY